MIKMLLPILLLFPAQEVCAHIVLADPGVEAGTYYAGFFRVSHGCDGSDTIALRIEIPDGVSSAKPQPKPGWTIAIEHAPLAAPVPAEGGRMLAERVSAVTWSGRLSADQFDQFGLMMKLPARAGPIYFPAVQTCAGRRVEWRQIPATGQSGHDLANPAPVLMLRGTDESHSHMGH